MNFQFFESCGRLSLAAVLLAGCCTTPLSPKQAFFRRHPELRERYAEFYETSPEAITERDDSVHQAEYVTLHALRKGYAKYPDLMQSTDEVEKNVDRSVAANREFVQEIKNDFDPRTDALFYFNYREGDEYETGYLILRRGEIQKKFFLEGPFTRKGRRP